MDAPRPMTAFVGTLYVGTDMLGRPLTNEENKQLAAHLRAYDFIGASMVSLRFAYTLRRSRSAAQDLQGRANLRLVCQGWDSAVVTLVKRLCRLVWSEDKHEKRESAAARRAEERFLLEQKIHGADVSHPVDALAIRLEEERREESLRGTRLEALRAAMTEARDDVNLLWIDYRLKGVTDLERMATENGLRKQDFYDAADRRKRLVARLIAANPDWGRPKDEEKT